jgi:uncharacterized protein YecT (DUF1311 family)
MRYANLLACGVAICLLSGPALAAGAYPPGEPGLAPPPPQHAADPGAPVSLTAYNDEDHNAPVPVRTEPPRSPMGFNPVTTVDPGPADTAPAPMPTDPPQVLMTPPPTESPVRADNEEAGTMMPRATTMPASNAVTISGPMDFSTLCHADATGNVDIHDCLTKAMADADAQLEAAQSEELKVARGGPDWKEGRTQAQLLSVSAMSFNAYRDSECLRQQQASVPGQKTGDIMLACQIRLTQARVAMLGHPEASVPAPAAPQPPQPMAGAEPLPPVQPAPLTPMDAQPLPAPQEP